MCPFCSNHFDIGALYMHVRTMYKISAYTSFILRHLETKIPFLFGEIMTCNHRKCKCLSFAFVLTLSYAGSFPGLPDRIQGRFSQNSSLMISTWSITTCAFRRSLRILSCCDLDC